MGGYRMVERENATTIRMCHGTFGGETWVAAIAKTRTPCDGCRATVPPRAQIWLPLAFGQNRLHRLCAACVSKAEAALKEVQKAEKNKAWANQPWAQKKWEET